MTYPGVQVPYLSYRGATGNRLAQDPLAYSGLQRLLSQEIDLAPQQIFQLVPQAQELDADPGLHIHDQVHVTGWSGFPSGY
jgi:hypothetical protein